MLMRWSRSFDLTKGTYDQAFLKASKKLLELIMIRRTKEGVKTQLAVPPREEITCELSANLITPSLPLSVVSKSVYVPLSVCQRFWTKRLLLKQDDAALRSAPVCWLYRTSY